MNMTGKHLLFVYLPAVDWLLFNVKAVADWLLTAVVEQQAGGIVREPGEKINLSELLKTTIFSHMISH